MLAKPHANISKAIWWTKRRRHLNHRVEERWYQKLKQICPYAYALVKTRLKVLSASYKKDRGRLLLLILREGGGGSWRKKMEYPILVGTLNDLGDLSKLIGLLSWTIQQYSPPRKWIMCQPCSQGSLLPALRSERERPWKTLVTCLSESGRLQTNDLGEGQVSVRCVSSEHRQVRAAMKLCT